MWNKGTLRCSPQVLPHLIMTPHVFLVMKWAVRLTRQALIADRRCLWKQSCSSDQNKPLSICPVLICEGSESPVWQRYVMSTGCIPDDEVWTHQLRKNSTMNFFLFEAALSEKLQTWFQSSGLTLSNWWTARVLYILVSADSACWVLLICEQHELLDQAHLWYICVLWTWLCNSIHLECFWSLNFL